MASWSPHDSQLRSSMCPKVSLHQLSGLEGELVVLPVREVVVVLFPTGKSWLGVVVVVVLRLGRQE